MTDFHAAAQRYLAWATETFDATDRRPVDQRFESCLRHAEKEIDEVRSDPDDATEFVDAIALVLFAAHLSGHSLNDLAAAWDAKLVQLRDRTWAMTPDGTIEHVR